MRARWKRKSRSGASTAAGSDLRMRGDAPSPVLTRRSMIGGYEAQHRQSGQQHEESETAHSWNWEGRGGEERSDEVTENGGREGNSGTEEEEGGGRERFQYVLNSSCDRVAVKLFQSNRMEMERGRLVDGFVAFLLSCSFLVRWPALGSCPENPIQSILSYIFRHHSTGRTSVQRMADVDGLEVLPMHFSPLTPYFFHTLQNFDWEKAVFRS